MTNFGKRIWIGGVLWLWLILMPFPALASSAPAVPELDFALRFDHVFELGVPGGQVFLEDALGFLWFGSEGGGLFRWDGYTLKNYPPRSDSGLSNGSIYRILQDRADPYVLWIGTGNGLNRFDQRTETFTVYRSNPDDPQTLSSDTSIAGPVA